MPRPALPKPIGLIPAAGRGSRLGLSWRSKEALALGWRTEGGALRPVSAFGRLLEAYRRAGVEETWIGLRAGKWEVAEAVAGEPEPPRRVWRILAETSSITETLAAILDGRHDVPALLGFPDILFAPLGLVGEMVETFAAPGGGAPDVLLGAVPGARPLRSDMIDVDADGRITRYEMKDPAGAELPWTWILALWGPRFGGLLRRWSAAPPDLGREPQIGDVVLHALETGLDVRALVRDDGATLDVGTPEDFLAAPRWLAEHA